VAKSDAAHLKLSEQFRRRQIEKRYIAMVHGRIKSDSGSISLPVARDRVRRVRMTTRRREGREARTGYRVLRRLDGFTLVEATLHTGRTHQIRVHFSALGHPVVGDTLYGAPRAIRMGKTSLGPLGRNFLHAASVRFHHPSDDRVMEIRAPLPPELVAFEKQLGRAV
jgi:23S rRNA pseudouridine1911/1915/1917 synthase